MDPAEVLIYVFVAAALAVFPFPLCIIWCCPDTPREEERHADAVAQLAVAVQQTRTLLAAEQAGRLEATAERLASAAAAAAAAVNMEELGYFPYSVGGGSTSEQRQPECAICLEAFVQGATCGEVPSCRHLFHRECIARWMRSNKTTCPLCRDRIPTVPGSEPLSAAQDMV